MKQLITFTIMASLLALAMPAFAMQGHSDSGGHDSQGHSSESGSMDDMDHEAAAGMGGEAFMHHEMVDGIEAQYQVMSLQSMGMSDPEGATHHVMVNFMHEGSDMKMGDIVGKVKLIAPSGKEQEAALKNYDGTYAANFTIDEPGKWGVITLFKEGDEKHLVKFWYPHE